MGIAPIMHNFPIDMSLQHLSFLFLFKLNLAFSKNKNEIALLKSEKNNTILNFSIQNIFFYFDKYQIVLISKTYYLI